MGFGSFNLPLQVAESSAQEYTRNPEWITLQDVHATNSEISGLFGVFESTSVLALNVSVVGGYTVDWGDGNVENVASGVQANHNYVFTDVNVATLTTLGYRQAIVRVYAQTPANHFTSVLFNLRHSSLTQTYATNWLEVKMRTTSACTTFDFYKSSVVVTHNACTLFSWVGTFGGASLTNTFTSLPVIEKIDIPDISNSAINMASMFLGCTKLYNVTIGSLTTGNKTITSFFSGCLSLVVAPMFNTSGITSVASMFDSCTKLEKVPLYDFSSVTAANLLFSGCIRLNDLPVFNFSSNLNFTSTFSGCTNLETVPLMTFKTGSGSVTGTSMFSGCIRLKTIPALDFSRFTTTASMFNACSSLVYLPPLNLSNSANIGSMFFSCSALKVLPVITFSSSVDATSMFGSNSSNWCASLETIEASDFVNVTGLTLLTPNLTRNKGTNITAAGLTVYKMNKANFIVDFIQKYELPTMGIMGGVITLTNSIVAAEAPAYSKTSCTTTAGSTVILCANTSSLAVGMYVSGTGTSASTNRTVTSTDLGTDTFTLVNHGLQNNDLLTFNNSPPGGTTNGRVNYVINATADTFQVSATLGGSPINITSGTTPPFRTVSRIVSINTNVDITMDRQQHTSGTNTLIFRDFNISVIAMRFGSITG